MALDVVLWSRKFEVVVLVLASLSFSSLACPVGCQCGQQPFMIYVHCVNVNLSAIPAGIPPSTTDLSFIKTQIRSIPENAFQGLSNANVIGIYESPLTSIAGNAFRGLTRLRELSLTSNNLADLTKDSFKGLTALTRINFANNKLRSLPEGVFADTVNLQILTLSHNEIASVSSNLLTGLESLSFLSLPYNRISYIGDGAFSSVASSLRHLDLDNNHLTQFPVKLLKNLTSLSELRLARNNFSALPSEVQPVFNKIAEKSRGKISISQNPLVCTKELEWLQTWMKAHPGKVIGLDRVTCRAPDGSWNKVLDYNFELLGNWSIGPLKNGTTASPAASSTTSSSTATATSSSTSSATSSSTATATSSTTSPISSASTPVTTPSPPATVTTRKASSTIASVKSTIESKNNQTTTLSTPLSSKWKDNKTTEVEIPTTTFLTFTPGSKTFISTIPPKKDSETKKSSLTRNEEVILAASLVGVFLVVIAGVMLYCFRRKVLMRQKKPIGLSTKYDRVNGVV